MTDNTNPTKKSLDELSQDLAALARDGSPAIASLAQWVLDRPQEIAFNSVRGLAQLADVNVNTAYRLSVALGFSGYDACRREFQSALRRSKGLYGQRASQLSGLSGTTLIDGLLSATHANLDETLSGENVEKIRAASQRLLVARRIYCVGVRSCFSLAHYLAYTGGMAFRSFERPLVETGSIADTIAHADPGDIAILITFSLYSAEVVRAHDAALSKGVDVIAITDSYASPIARQAKVVFCLPMAGPQPLPSHGAGFALAEAIVAEMIAQDAGAPDRIAAFEDQMLQLGNYVAAKK